MICEIFRFSRLVFVGWLGLVAAAGGFGLSEAAERYWPGGGGAWNTTTVEWFDYSNLGPAVAVQAYLPLDGNTTGGQGSPISGTAIGTNAASPTYQAGKFGQAAFFNNTNANTTPPNNWAVSLGNLDPIYAGDFSVSIWVQWTGTPNASADKAIIGNTNWASGNNTGWTLTSAFGGTAREGKLKTSTGTRQNTAIAWKDGAWNLVTLTVDNTAKRGFWYLNGTLQNPGGADFGSGTFAAGLNTLIGGSGNGTYSAATTRADDVGIFSGMLPAATIADIYDNGAGRELASFIQTKAWDDTNQTAVFRGAGGTVTIDAGGVTAGGVRLESAGYTLAGGPLTLAGAIDVRAAATISADITALSLVKSGTGSLTLTGSNAIANGTTWEAGNISIATGSGLGSGPITMTGTAARTLTVANTAAQTFAPAIVLPDPASAINYTIVKNSSGTATGTDLDLTGIISGGGPNATLFFNSSTSSDSTTTYTLSGDNTFRGRININRGALVVAHENGLGDSANLVRLATNPNTTLGNLRFNLPMTVPNPIELVGTYPINTNEHAVTLDGVVSGAGALQKLGTGTLTVTAANTHQGGAIVSAGTLVAADSAALGAGPASVAAGARLRLDPDAIIANAIADLGTVGFLGTLEFAGGGLARTSTAGGSTLGTLLAGSAASAAELNPNIAWLPQTDATASDIMRLTNTAGTAQVLSLTYDPILAPAAPQDAYLGWFDTGSGSWVNAIAGNGGGTSLFFSGSWSDYLVANPTATPASALGAYGHDTATSTVWAVMNHNSDFAVIVVPEPNAIGAVAVGLAALAGLRSRRSRRRAG